MERFKNNSWDETEEREDIEYLETEKEIWMEEYPIMAARMFQEEEDGIEESGLEEVEGSGVSNGGDDDVSERAWDVNLDGSDMSDDRDETVK